MRFGVPYAFWGLLAVPAVIALFIFASSRGAAVRRRLGVSGTVARMFAPRASGKMLAAQILIVIGLVALVGALVRPQMGGKSVMVKREGVDMLFLLDVSRSMSAKDTSPNRLERSKFELARLIDTLHGDRVGIIIFSGKAFVQCPLTSDYAAARTFLQAVQIGDIPENGTSLGNAFELAATLLPSNQARAVSRVGVAVTDGEDFSKDTNAAVTKLKDENVKIFTVGVGSAAGEPIPIDGEGSGYLKDEGKTVMSRRNDTLLREIADETGGKYYNLQEGSDLTALVNEVSKMEKEEFKSEIYTQYNEQYVWPLLLSFICFAIAFLLDERKGSWLGLGFAVRRHGAQDS